ncbi:hypothetical protein [Cupriavidus basilensis]|uniref:hypothetical protein n=1 Tax=Cupriavidus basilensis TaxID=68895 RepID=UPI00157A73D3|nr:hypothetical protein [Cupriavidus basilensis]NUA28675.1 hypothetical protein [Cupriavidus basilensis]
MTPLQHFQTVWERCNELAALHEFLSGRLTAALRPDELLRAEWVARVSALDLYVHEIVAQRMTAIFDGQVAAPAGNGKFQISADVLMRIRSAPTKIDASAAFDLEVRSRLGFLTFQDPDKIADGIRLISGRELWNEVALHCGATQATKVAVAKGIKRGLSLIVERRNKIAHEGDLQPGGLRTPWPISRPDLREVERIIYQVVTAIDAVV